MYTQKTEFGFGLYKSKYRQTCPKRPLVRQDRWSLSIVKIVCMVVIEGGLLEQVVSLNSWSFSEQVHLYRGQ